MKDLVKALSNKSSDLEIASQSLPITGQLVGSDRKALEVLNTGWLEQVATDAAEANSTAIMIVATAHSAEAGMVLEFTSGVHNGKQVPVLSVETNAIYLGERLDSAVGTGDTFSINRPTMPKVADFTSITATLSTLDVIEFVRNDYSSTNVTTGAYVELIASTSAEAKKIQIFDSSGETLYLALGAAASEVDKLIIVPGGNGEVEVAIPASSRISVKAISATANTGEIVINLLG